MPASLRTGEPRLACPSHTPAQGQSAVGGSTPISRRLCWAGRFRSLSPSCLCPPPPTSLGTALCPLHHTPPPLTPTSLGTTPLSRVPAPGACLAESSPCRRAPSGRREAVRLRQKRLSARCTPASCSPRCRGRSTWAGRGRAWAPGSADVLSLSGASTVDPLSRGAYCGVRKPRVPPPTSVSPPVSWGLDGV